MEEIMTYICKALDNIDKNLRGIVRIGDKRYKQFLFVAGLGGSILWLQHNEIKSLRGRIFDTEQAVYELQEEIFNRKVKNTEEVASDE